MSGIYGQAEDNESVATIHAALDDGIALIDTGDFYGMGHNEMLIGRALIPPQQSRALCEVWWFAHSRRRMDRLRARPVSVKNFAAYSLTRLGVDYIDIYRPARLDPQVPIEDTIGAISELVKAGYVPPHRTLGGWTRHHPPRACGATPSATFKSNTL